MTASPSRGTLLSAAYLRVLAVQFSFGVAYSAFLLLPKYLRVELEASAAEIGAISGVALVVAALASPLIGLSQRAVSRRALLVGALLLQAVGGFGFLFLREVGPAMYVLRSMQGLAWVLVFNSTAIIVADFVPTHRLSEGIGLIGVAMLVTNALAPGVAEPVAARFGWDWVFAVPSVIALAAIALVPGLPEPTPPEAGTTGSAVRGTVSPALLSVYWGSLLMGAGIAVMFTFTQPFALSLGAKRVGDFFFGYVAAALMVRLGLAWIADRLGPGRIAAASLVLYAVTVAGGAWLRPALLLWLGVGLGVSHGFLYPALTAFGMARLRPEQRSVYMGWLTGAFNAGFALAALGLGPVADQAGYPAVFLIVGGLLATGVLPLALAQHGAAEVALE